MFLGAALEKKEKRKENEKTSDETVFRLHGFSISKKSDGIMCKEKILFELEEEIYHKRKAALNIQQRPKKKKE